LGFESIPASLLSSLALRDCYLCTETRRFFEQGLAAMSREGTEADAPLRLEDLF
jgi:hypothetical protein